jgi:hypothetical protein
MISDSSSVQFCLLTGNVSDQIGHVLFLRGGKRNRRRQRHLQLNEVHQRLRPLHRLSGGTADMCPGCLQMQLKENTNINKMQYEEDIKESEFIIIHIVSQIKCPVNKSYQSQNGL